MLYGIGIVLLLVSASFVGGSVIVPVTIASVGIVLMSKGGKHGNKAHTERQGS